ncbi:MAG: hypothetical protein ACTS2F_14800 [Thainema sp.]
MIRVSNRVANVTQTSAATGLNLWKTVIQFWRFSQFHGRYQSLPLDQRQQLIREPKN